MENVGMNKEKEEYEIPRLPLGLLDKEYQRRMQDPEYAAGRARTRTLDEQEHQRRLARGAAILGIGVIPDTQEPRPIAVNLPDMRDDLARYYIRTLAAQVNRLEREVKALLGRKAPKGTETSQGIDLP